MEIRPNRNNSEGIDVVVGEIVMPFDMVHIHGPGNARLVIQLPQVPPQVRIINDSADIALEVKIIDGVEPDQGAKEPPIRFDHA